MDVRPRRYETFADLEPYCLRVASAVGLICAEIFGYREEATLTYARDLGVALQLTNILRDVAVDRRQGRLYLPLDDLARFGCSPADIDREIASAGHGVQSPAVRSVLEHQAARARVFFARAVQALPKDDARGFLAAEIMRAIYADLLDRIGSGHLRCLHACDPRAPTDAGPTRGCHARWQPRTDDGGCRRDWRRVCRVECPPLRPDRYGAPRRRPRARRPGSAANRRRRRQFTGLERDR